MDKNSMFNPTKDEAQILADNYWADLTGYREKTLNHLSDLIKSNAKEGRYQITSEIFKQEKDYIKGKLEDVGYKVELLDGHEDKKYIYIKVYFK